MRCRDHIATKTNESKDAHHPRWIYLDLCILIKARKKDLHATNYEAKGVSKETDIYKEDGLCGKS